eukprot:4858335-Prorocentrum_lima.AAC.1
MDQLRMGQLGLETMVLKSMTTPARNLAVPPTATSTRTALRMKIRPLGRDCNRRALDPHNTATLH